MGRLGSSRGSVDGCRFILLSPLQNAREEMLVDFNRYWYHKITLPDGQVTPGMDLEPIWQNVREVREHLDFAKKTVLDIASFDGMWAFEAEALGAGTVVATDCLWGSFENFRQVSVALQSAVLPFYNVNPYDLSSRLDVFFEENYDQFGHGHRGFDIVQHLGLLYHLRDPMLSLSQTRSVMKTGAKLLIETEMVMDSDASALFFNDPTQTGRIRDNYSVWWAPTELALDEMLKASFLRPVKSTQQTIEFDVPRSAGGVVAHSDNHPKMRVGRTALIAEAVTPSAPLKKWEREMMRTYRNPGLDLLRLGWERYARGGHGFE